MSQSYIYLLSHGIHFFSTFFYEHIGVTMTSELYLADLGGSEQVKRSKVSHGGYVSCVPKNLVLISTMKYLY